MPTPCVYAMFVLVEFVKFFCETNMNLRLGAMFVLETKITDSEIIIT